MNDGLFLNQNGDDNSDDDDESYQFDPNLIKLQIKSPAPFDGR